MTRADFHKHTKAAVDYAAWMTEQSAKLEADERDPTYEECAQMEEKIDELE